MPHPVEICDECKTKVIDLYQFKLRAHATWLNQSVNAEESVRDKFSELDSNHTEDKSIYTTMQVVRKFAAHHLISEIIHDGFRLIIKRIEQPKSTESPTFPVEELPSIKEEPQENKIKPEKELPDIKQEIVELTTEFKGEDFYSSEEHTNSNSSEGSHSRLPAFKENSYFNGDRFVIRGTEPPSMKNKRELKRRIRNPDLWATNIQKKLRNAGQPYRNAKGFLVDARTMGPPCICRKECATKVNEKNRLMNFSKYWNLSDTMKKRKFIFNHITLERPMRAMTKSRASSRMIHHFLDVKNSDGTIELVQVCKSMFLQTLDISATVISSSIKFKDQY